jgi:opacity protein-like surface antigen
VSLAAVATLLASLSAGDDPWEPPSYRRMLPDRAVESAAPLPLVLPRVLAEEEPESFSMGPEGGYLRARDADRGTWFAGVKARLHVLRFLAAEASITFHQNRYAHDDIVVTQYPVQLTAFLYILPVGPIRPYVLGGVGWYYTRTDYRGSLSFIENSTSHFFGVHLGAGAEIMLGTHASIDADARYIFVNATTQQVLDDRNFNYWQITFGLNFYF